MQYDSRIREEELKNRVAEDFFPIYDCVHILGNVDFSVCVKDSTPSLFDNDFLVWGEAKRGSISDFKTSFVQLVLTIGKERTFDKYLPPRFLCEFDSKQIAFLPYDKILEVFYINDFNWNVTPSNHNTREFSELYTLVSGILDSQSFIFKFDEDEKILRSFIKNNFKVGVAGVSRAKITKNNFISIYNRWLEDVKPTIQIPNWDALKRNGVLDADFFLADIMSKDNMPIMNKLQVLLMKNYYMLARQINESGLFTSSQAPFTDEGAAHARFWLKYDRPPKKEYQEFILNRRDLLVPQDIRERKGSYFTPRCWVEKAYEYLEAALGENWQDRYYVWDCCSGTGNLIAGLFNKYNVYASTLDKSDVDIIHERITNGANLLPDHVFQFDFLNDGFQMTSGGLVDNLCQCEKLPQSLRDILADDDKRQRLILLQNPPYAEAGDAKQSKHTGRNKNGVAVESNTYKLYFNIIGKAAQELYAQFIFRQYSMMPGAIIAEFSKLKIIQAQNFVDFRKHFSARLLGSFVVPADTFDNVKGKFPVGFFIWDTTQRERIRSADCDIFDADGYPAGVKQFHSFESHDVPLTKWLSSFRDKDGERIGDINQGRNDFQNQNYCYIKYDVPDLSHRIGITKGNLVQAAVYFAVRKVIPATWLNDRDQFYAPLPEWRHDSQFASDCLVYTLFNLDISMKDGPNHWIPFTEEEVSARERFGSHFMQDFLKGRLPAGNDGMFPGEAPGTKPMNFSEQAVSVLNAGRALWRYYHSMEDSVADAALFDIRGYFQGFKANGHMNATGNDAEYMRLIGELRGALKLLAYKIEPKVYEYGFLK